ncbi:GreA/GreB family elongation factor [Planctomycetota bacterium]
MHQIPKVLAVKDYAVFRAAVEEGNSDDADDVRRILQHHITLTDQSRDEITRVIRLAHPDLFTEHVSRWEEATVYTTTAGLEKRQKEYTQLVNVDLVEIGKEIGTAAELGDLSENAEFTAALEQRDRLSKRASMMEEELANTRILTADMVQSDKVTVGSGVRAKDTGTGKTETYIFLGPWDIDPEKGVYSYRAPIGLAFMGKMKGDTVEFEAESGPRQWEILEVFPGIKGT